MLPVLRATRAARVNTTRVVRNTHTARNVRFASTESVTPSTPAGSGAVTGGLVGGGAALLITYGWYHFSGAKSAVQTARQAKGYLDSATESLKIKFDENTPDDTNQAIKTLKDTANKYAAFIPGGSGYVDSAFNDLETIRKQHGDEADKIVREAYGELRDVSKKGMNLEAANEAYSVLSKQLQRLLELAKDASEEILNNHPQLKEKLGGSAEQLKHLGDQIGPEAKKEIDDVWQRVNQIMQAGLSVEAINKGRQLLQEKRDSLQKFGETTFNKGYEQLKPALEKSPQIKQFVEQNLETLKQGKIGDTFQKVQQAISSGSTQELEDYLKQIGSKAQQFSSSDISQWLGMIPGGSMIIPQLQQLKDVAHKKGPEAEQLVKDTIAEIKKVLDQKKDKVEELAKDVENEAQGS